MHLERFNPKPPFGRVAAHTWGLIHGTTIPGATSILIEGLIRPADWEHHADSKRSQLPTFGLFSMGQEISGDTKFPSWAETLLLDCWTGRRRKEKANNNQSPSGPYIVAPNNT